MATALATKAEFNAAMANAENKLCVIDFTATWCGPCKAVAPKFHQLAEECKDALFFVVDVDVNGETAEECGVQSMPTFKFYKAGKDVHTVSGGDLEAIKTNIAKFK